MALFQKSPHRLEVQLPYTLSTNARKQLLIIGLGNPGKQYAGTRHNIGFEVLDNYALANNFSTWQANKKFNGNICQANINDTSVILLKPNTYMNLSGESARAVMDFYKISLNDTLVVYDELSINFGQIRMRKGGQSAGHNGIKSLISHIGQDFDRIRVGIKNDLSLKKENSEFVLAKFTKTEKSHLPDLYNEVSTVITERIYGGQLPHDTRTIILS